MFGGRRRTNGERGGFDDCVPVDGGELPVSIEAKAYAKVQLQEKWVIQARRNAGARPWIIAQRPKGWRRPIATVDLEWLAWLVATHEGPLTPPTNQQEERNVAQGATTG
jgi:hypothetical protein